MQKIFDTLINGFIDHQVGISDDFLGKPLSGCLRKNLVTLYNEQQLKPAGTGNETLVAHDTLFRSDSIYWLDREHNDPHENDFFDLIDRFVAYLNSTCYTGITGYEFHYALYEEGSFYKKHRDQFHDDQSRQYSMIMYLNEGWTRADAGELCIHHNGAMQHISPVNGKIVFFKSSELEHEVLVTHKPRLSITGWLKTG